MMTEKTFHFSGYVKNRENKPVPDLRVEAWDKDLFFDDFVAEAVTNPDGRFHMSFPDKRFRELFFDRRPDLYFKVREGREVADEVIKDTSDSILWNVESDATDLKQPIVEDVRVDEQPQAAVTPWLIGRPLNEAIGESLTGFTWTAFRKERFCNATRCLSTLCHCAFGH